MIYIIYKTVKPSHLKKLQMMQNTNKPNVPSHFYNFDWILVKQIIVSSNHFVRASKFSRKYCLKKWVISLCLQCDDKDFGASFGLRRGVGSKWLTLGKEGFAWKTVFKDFPNTIRISFTDGFKFIASHKKCIFLNTSGKLLLKI